MSLSKILISKTFLKPNWSWFQRKWQEKNRLVSEKNDRKNIQNVKTTNNTLYKPDLPILHVLNVNYLIESSTLKLVKIAKQIKQYFVAFPKNLLLEHFCFQYM